MANERAMMQDPTGAELAARVEESLAERFGEQLRVDPELTGLDELARIAGHRVHREFLDRPVEPADNSCSGFQPSSATLRIDCDDALPVEIL